MKIGDVLELFYQLFEKKSFWLYFTLLTLVVIAGVGIALNKESGVETDNVRPSFVEEESEIKQEEGSGDGNEAAMVGDEQAATLTADLVCILTDPTFWDDFFEDFWDGEEQTEEELAAEDAQYLALLQSHGYNSEAEAESDVARHWGADSFKSKVKTKINAACPGAVENAEVDLDALLNGPPLTDL